MVETVLSTFADRFHTSACMGLSWFIFNRIGYVGDELDNSDFLTPYFCPYSSPFSINFDVLWGTSASAVGVFVCRIGHRYSGTSV